jgi:hypothetical protein
MAHDEGCYYGILDKGKRGDPLSSAKKKTKQTSSTGTLANGASVCIDQRSLWPAMSPAQNKGKKQSALSNAVQLLEHRTGFYLVEKAAEINPARAS